jgi:hypothetical protein
LKGACGISHGLRDHTDSIDGRDARSLDGRTGWIDNSASNRFCLH